MDKQQTTRRNRRQAPTNNMSLKSIVAAALNKPAPSASSRTMRNRRRRMNRAAARITTGIPAGKPYVSSTNVPINFLPPSMSMGQSSQIRDMNTSLRRVLKTPKLTPDGISFLKCAFAPPDFATSSVRGVPDAFGGNSLSKKHRFTSNVTNNGGRDLYILMAPVPGIAYFYTEIPAGTLPNNATAWVPVSYPDIKQIFPSVAAQTSIITKFRYISQHIELIPTVNSMQWSGSITAWKLNPQSITRPNMAALTNGVLTISGLEAAAGAFNAQCYMGPVINGIFAGAYSASSTFEFSDIYDNCSALPQQLIGSDHGQLVGDSTSGIPGFDNGFESLCLRITNNGEPNQFIMRNFACVEYIVNASASLYEYQSVSCDDPQALALYKAIIKELPVGVTYHDNENFWKRVLGIVRMLSGSMSVLPGPYGAVAGGVNAIATGINELTL